MRKFFESANFISNSDAFISKSTICKQFLKKRLESFFKKNVKRFPIWNIRRMQKKIYVRVLIKFLNLTERAIFHSSNGNFSIYTEKLDPWNKKIAPFA